MSAARRYDVHMTVQDDLGFIRFASGLSWETLGRVLGASSHAVHMWSRGGRTPLSADRRVAELAAETRRVIHASGAANRRAVRVALEPYITARRMENCTRIPR